MSQLAESDPELHAVMEGRDHVLPPRPGGVLSLLDKGMDVVFVAHTGLESMRGIKEIWTIAPVGRTVRLDFRRVPSKAIPADQADRVRWLFEEWARVDDSITMLREGIED